MRRSARFALVTAGDGSRRAVLLLSSCLASATASAATFRELDPAQAIRRATGTDIAECLREAPSGWTLDFTSESPSMSELIGRVARAERDAPEPFLLAAAVIPVGSEPDAPTRPENDIPMRTRNDKRVENGNGGPVPPPTRWQLAPIRFGGNVSLDGRWVRSDDGLTTRQGLLAANIDAMTYVWQPWFVQLRAGVGGILSRGTNESIYDMRRSDDSSAWTGRLGLQVFPASRFPFEFRADVTDSRATGDIVGTDYRNTRVGVSQSYRPLRGNENYNLSYDYSALATSRLPEDTVQTVRGLFVKTVGSHAIEFSGSDTVNERGGSDDTTRLSLLHARHGYRPSAAFTVDNLATFNEIRVRSVAADVDLASEIKQISSFASWRPQQGDRGYSEMNRLVVTGNVRFVDSQVLSSSSSGSRRSADGALGVNYDINRNLRLGSGVAVSHQTVAAEGVAPGADRLTLTTESAALTYTPDSSNFANWRYSPTAAVNASATQGAIDGSRNTQGVQLGHGLGRSWLGDEGGLLSLNLSQSVGVTHDSQQADLARTLGHSVSVYRQFANAGMTQSYGSLSFSDSRSYGAIDSSFQLINGQFTQRKQLTRNSSWSGSLTAQATRARFGAGGVDPLNGMSMTPASDQGWRKYYSGSLTYEHMRAFDVPRLRFIALASANSQQLQSRVEGDVDAPRERIDHLFEARLEYTLGRLDMRLVGRTAQVESRRVDSVFFRINRRFGN